MDISEYPMYYACSEFLSVVTDRSLLACSHEALKQMTEYVGVCTSAKSKQAIIADIRRVCPLQTTARDKTVHEILDGCNHYHEQSQSFANVCEYLKGPIGSYITREFDSVQDIFEETPEDSNISQDYEKEVYLIDVVSNLKKRVRNHFLLENNTPSKKMIAMKVLTEETKNSMISFFSKSTTTLLKRDIQLGVQLDAQQKLNGQDVDKDAMIDALQKQINDQQKQIKELNGMVNRKTITYLEDRLSNFFRRSCDGGWLTLTAKDCKLAFEVEKLSAKLETLFDDTGKMVNLAEHFNGCQISILKEILGKENSDVDGLELLAKEFLISINPTTSQTGQ